MESEVESVSVFEPYTLAIKPQHMSTFGTMCDYGVRSHNQSRLYGYIEIGIASGIISESLSRLLEEDHLTVEEAYELVTQKAPKRIGDEMRDDYNEITRRALIIYETLRLVSPMFGAYYNTIEPINSIECDCVTDTHILDMKVSRTCEHNKEHWTQVLLYSLLAKMRDSKSRRHLLLIYPVQGVVKHFYYPKDQYAAMYKVFVEKEIVEWNNYYKEVGNGHNT